MKTAADIIEALGGSAPIAKATRFPLTTVNSWKEANFIPEWRRAALLALAKAGNVPLKASDFPPVEHRKSRSQAAA